MVGGAARFSILGFGSTFSLTVLKRID